MKNNITRILALALVLCCCFGTLAAPALAASIDDATIDLTRTGSITVYAYDWTNAAKDGVWSADSYVSTGQYDSNVNNILGLTAVRQGDSDTKTDLENGQSSNGYALKGKEFTYLKVADFYQFTESERDGSTAAHVELLYRFDKTAAASLLSAIGLAGGKDSYANANALDSAAWFYQSDVINAALKAALAADSTAVKDALETYVTGNGGVAMPLTDENGRTIATNLPLGLYLMVETKVPEMVTSTTAPFIVSLPMTTVNGGGDGSTGNTTKVTNGGHEWLYDVTVYPKNETGIVSLEKTVREAVKDTGKNNASDVITDGYLHNATASAGDTVEYQIISTLPTITSQATAISVYTFQDVLSRGLSYDSKTPVKIEWFTDKDCTNKVTTWNAGDGKFTVSKAENSDGSHTMTIAMTAAGLAEINAGAGSVENSNDNYYGDNVQYAGYSNYTLRITYGAILNSDESLVYGDDGNDNQVVLTWKRTSASYYDTLVDDCHIYVYGINLTKTFSDGKDDQELFDNVLFKLQNATDGYYVTAKLNEEEGIWYVTGHTAQESAATAMHPVTWNGQKGQLVVKGLEDDEYIFTELETADGYTLLKQDIHVTISAADDPTRPCAIYDNQAVLGVIQNDPRYSFDGGLDLTLANIPQTALAHNYLTASATVDGNAVVMLNDDMDAASTNALAPLTVVNTHGFDLPQTGEIWAKWLPMIGAVIIGVSVLVVCLLPKRKDDKTE